MPMDQPGSGGGGGFKGGRRGGSGSGGGPSSGGDEIKTRSLKLLSSDRDGRSKTGGGGSGAGSHGNGLRSPQSDREALLRSSSFSWRRTDGDSFRGGGGGGGVYDAARNSSTSTSRKGPIYDLDRAEGSSRSYHPKGSHGSEASFRRSFRERDDSVRVRSRGVGPTVEKEEASEEGKSSPVKASGQDSDLSEGSGTKLSHKKGFRSVKDRAEKSETGRDSHSQERGEGCKSPVKFSGVDRDRRGEGFAVSPRRTQVSSSSHWDGEAENAKLSSPKRGSRLDKEGREMQRFSLLRRSVDLDNNRADGNKASQKEWEFPTGKGYDDVDKSSTRNRNRLASETAAFDSRESSKSHGRSHVKEITRKGSMDSLSSFASRKDDRVASDRTVPNARRESSEAERGKETHYSKKGGQLRKESTPAVDFSGDSGEADSDYYGSAKSGRRYVESNAREESDIARPVDSVKEDAPEQSKERISTDSMGDAGGKGGEAKHEVSEDTVMEDRCPSSRAESEMEEGELEPENAAAELENTEVASKDSTDDTHTYKGDAEEAMEIAVPLKDVEENCDKQQELQSSIDSANKHTSSVIAAAEENLAVRQENGQSRVNEVCRLPDGDVSKGFSEMEQNASFGAEAKTPDGGLKSVEVEESQPELTLDLLGVSRSSGAQEEKTQREVRQSQRDDDTERELSLSLGGGTKSAAAPNNEAGVSEADDASKHINFFSIVGEQSRTSLGEKSENARHYYEKSSGSKCGLEGLVVGPGGHRQKRPKLEPLQPLVGPLDTSLRLASPGPSQLPGCFREPTRSVRSVPQTQTSSDGFTRSVSFNQSHSFVHNPSCSLNNPSFSLTRTTLDNQEYSCAGSQQISQGNEAVSHASWPAFLPNDVGGGGASTSQDGWKARSLHQRWLPNSQALPAVSGSTKASSLNDNRDFGSDRMVQSLKTTDPQKAESSLGKRLDLNSIEKPQYEVVPAEHTGAPKDLKRGKSIELEKKGMPLEGEASASLKDKWVSVKNEDMTGSRSLQNEKIGVREVVTEHPVVMARKLQELPDSFLNGLKESVNDMLGSIERREEFMGLQKLINKRADLTQETLLRAHRTQLEILVALKTGIQSFVEPQGKAWTHTALTEVFLQNKCRNHRCQNPLPIDDCECRICSPSNGFCSACMCVVCFKFDMDANTCRWVGCDVCLHWCHMDCALHMSYIAPGPSIKGDSSSSGMQYRCIACGHPSELFGFVKEVFMTCAPDWNLETLAKELDAVKRMFHGSKDMKGKQLCWKAEEMLSKIGNKVDPAEVCRSMLRFFNEGDAELEGAPGNSANQLKPQDMNSKRVVSDAGGVGDFMPKVDSNAGRKIEDMDRARIALEAYDRELEKKTLETAELKNERAKRKAELIESERVVRVNLAEAKMFLLKAEAARLEANNLHDIVLAKCEEVEDDYAKKCSKLRLHEAEERRKTRLAEFQALERAQQDYLSMKTRMEADIKDLLQTMETMKRQLL